MHWPLRNYFYLLHLFHRINLLSWFLDYLPDFTEPSLTYNEVQDEWVQRYLSKLLLLYIFRIVLRYGGSGSFRPLFWNVFGFSNRFYILDAIKIDVTEINQKIQKVPDENLFLFVFRRTYQPKASISWVPWGCLRLELWMFCGADITAKIRGFEVVVKLDRSKRRVVLKLVAFKQQRRLSPWSCLPHFSDSLKWHNNLIRSKIDSILDLNDIANTEHFMYSCSKSEYKLPC